MKKNKAKTTAEEINKKNKFLVMFLIVAIFILLGLFLAILINLLMPMQFFCTLKMCHPSTMQGYVEVPCNSCGGEGKFYFFTGIINIKQVCPGQEIMIFQDGQLIDKRIDIGMCELKVTSFR